MFSLTSIAATALAVALGGTGTAAVVMNSPPAATDTGAEITAKANADLEAAEVAQRKAISLLSSATAEGKAEAQAQVELASTRLQAASTSMKAAVDTGSEAAVNAFAEFTDKSMRLVGSLANTASATANASIKASTDIVRAVDTQISTARGVATGQGDAVLSALTRVRAGLPTSITSSVSGGGQAAITPSVPSTSAGVSASGSVNGSASAPVAPVAPASAGLVTTATGTVTALLGGK